MLNYDGILKRANHFYQKADARRQHPSGAEAIRSEQVKALCRALVEGVNEELQKIEIARFQVKR
jgi:hypothetical protein